MLLSYDAGRIDGMKGEIKLSAPSYRERMRKIRDCQFKVTKEGEVESLMDNFDSMLKMIDFALDAIKEINVEHTSGAKATNLKELEYNKIFDPIFQDLASFYMNAGDLGNS